MPLVSQTIPSFKGGVSQQPDILRYPDQLQEQINGFSNEILGLQKRPPTLHVAKLRETVDADKVTYHLINRDDRERYLLQMSNGSLEVWDLQGNKKKVNFPNGTSYLTTDNPKKDLTAVTVADYTFILNKTVKTSMTEARTPEITENQVLMEVRSANYGKTFAIFIEGQFVAALKIPDGNEGWHSKWVDTARIAADLETAMRGVNPDPSAYDKQSTYRDTLSSRGNYPTIGFPDTWAERPQYNFKVVGDSVIAIQRKDKKPFKFELKDGFAGTNFYKCAGEAKSVTKLPYAAPDGYVAKIIGEAGSSDDDFYVKWNDSKKVWQECVAEGVQYQIAKHTMPWALVRESNGEFTFKQLDWFDRQVGDEDTNPDPSFIGNTINDIFFYRNRLGFVSDESIILSETGSFFNFWFKSSATTADTDPIDVSVSSNQVATLTHAVPFARELMLFSRSGQFVLSADGALSPKSVKVDQITNFDYSPECAPISVGLNIFFINKRAKYSSLMRYYTLQDFSENKDADDASAHVPTYIPNGIYRLSGNTTENAITCLSRSNPDTVWIYKFFIQNGQPVQQSWSKWTLGVPTAHVLLADFIGSELYYVIKTDAGVFLEKSEISGNVLDFSDEPVRLFMDRKVKYSVPEDSLYNDYDDYTVLDFKKIYGVIPYKDSKYYLVTKEGEVVDITEWDDQGTFKVSGDIRGKEFFIGKHYEFLMVLSKANIKQSNDSGGIVSEDSGRLQLRNVWVNYSNSGVFDVRVYNLKTKTDYKYVNTSRQLGVTTTVLGSNNTYTGKFKFPVHDNALDVNIAVISKDPLPINVLSGGWEGLYVRKSRRI